MPENQGSACARNPLRPHSHALALEPRILFDGAVAASVEQHHADTTHATEHSPIARAQVPVHRAPGAEPREGAVRIAPTAPTNLVVVDSRVANYSELLNQLPAGTKTLVINPGDNALASITAELSTLGNVDSIQIFSHGAAGQFTLGNQTFTADVLNQMAATLNSWRGELKAGADILLYGCDVGAGAQGKALVSTLASLTGAGVGASDNATGSAAAGGDWKLEVSSGVIDKSIALSASAINHYDGLLADASPVVTVSVPDNNVLLGNQVTFDVSFANSSSQVGYAPYVDLFMPATGKDGNDGLSFVSASYLGHAVTAYVITFDSNGNAVHPLAKDSSGNPLIINAAAYGMQPGDQLVVLQLPFASVTQGQPAISLQVTATLSNLADTSFSNGSPDLTVKARGGFQFGNDSLDNPTIDPSIVEAATSSLALHPTLVKITQSLDMPEGETATGPNYVHSETLTATPASGQTLSNVTLTQAVPANVQITAINPGSGTLTSLTLQDGSVVTDPTAMAVAIASDNLFIRSYTVNFASVSAPTSVVVSFYVPETDALGTPVLNTQTGASVVIDFGAPTATGSWVPLDPRDLPSGQTTIDFSGTGDGSGGSFLAKSITLLKQVADTADTGSPGVTPGDTLTYTLNLNISDYYAFGQTLLRNGSFTITDMLSDGQTLTGTPTLTFVMGGVSHTVALVATSTVNADGTTTVKFNIASSVLNAEQLGALVGDLAFDSTQDGATTATINYSVVVNQHYTPTYPQSEINEGDSFGNNATMSATLLVDQVNLTGFAATDDSSTTTTIGTSTVDIAITSVNGTTPPASGELNPGDVVTFQLSYDLLTGDYENMNLTAFLPLPLFNLTGINWSEGTGVGQWTLGAGNTNAGAIGSVATGAGNSVVFNLGNFATSITTGSRIELTFTLRVGDTPYADQRSLDVLAQSNQTTTINQQQLVSSDVTEIVSVAEPTLTITHGVVSTTDGTITGTTGTWSAPGSSGVPFTGNVTDLSTIKGSVSGIDAGDTLRLATAIENTGGGGAFDVSTEVTIPASLQFVGGSLATANLQIYRGDGTALVLGTDYSVSGSTITFLDAGNIPTLAPGRSGTSSDTTGHNVVVITYDVTAISNVAASATLQTTATLTHYASVEGGADFTPVDLIATTTEQVAAPTVNVVFAGGGTTAADSDSSASQTTGNNLVIGESMQYDIVVTVPEGSTQTLTLDDLIPAGMRLDTSFNNGLGYQVITTMADSSALGADYGGTLASATPNAMTGIGGTLGNDGVGTHWTFTAAGALADNNTGNNSFVIRVQLVADNVAGNQAGTQLPNTARISYSDPDGDTANGTVALTRTVNQTAPNPTAVIVEPTLQITQALASDPGVGVDAGDTVQYIITITNGSAGSDFDAYDINFQDILPTELNNLTFLGATYTGGATSNGGGDFELVGGTLRTVSGANIDIAKGGSITLTISGQVVETAASELNFNNTATVQWTSLNGTTGDTASPAGERTGADGVLNSGALNDYRSSSTLTVPVAQEVQISRVGGLPDTPAPSPTNAPVETVTVGEVIRYRVTSLLAEGENGTYNVQITLQNGLGFLNDGTTTIALVSNGGGITSTFGDLVTAGTLNVTGNQNSAIAQLIAADLSGAAPTGVFNTANHLTISTDSNGNQVLTFNLGDLNNLDRDADREGIVLEFNAQVLNQASNAAGTALVVSAVDRSGTAPESAVQSVTEQVVEPVLTGLNKQITSFDPNPSGSTGTATVAVSFTAGGTEPAFNAELQDGYSSGTNLTPVGLVVNGITYALNAVPGNLGFSFSNTGSTITADFSQIPAGTSVTLIYQITLPNTATVPASDAHLTWTSLPDNFTSWGGSQVGTAGGVNGERTGSGTGPNHYVVTESAGLGVISGTLWDDTFSATSSTTPDGTVLAGQTVTLTWAGVDGDFATTADNVTSTTTTDGSGHFQFGVLAAGNYQITAPATIANYTTSEPALSVRIDSDSASALGQVNITLDESGTGTANTGYVEQNQPPVNHLPATPPAGFEDTPLNIGGISISDVDAGNGTMLVTLGVTHGTLSMAAVNGVTITGQNSGTMTLSGSAANINTALAGLIYQGNLNYNGSDTLTINTNDNGNFGDHNSNGIPGEPADALSTQSTLQLNIAAVNDAPVGVNDVASATEAGGTNNQTVGINPNGNVLTNDTDVDIATNGDSLRVIDVTPAGGSTVVVPGVGVAIATGQYGTLTMTESGGALYTVDNSNPLVQALRTSNQTLTETFTYTLSDTGNAHATATITITIHGANDTPVANADTGDATEAGGVLNGTPGTNGTGNVLTNDTDVDSAANGEVLYVTGIRAAPAADTSPLTSVSSGTTSANGTRIVGTYGTLVIGADGTYQYVVDNSNPTVQALVPGSTPLLDNFSYQVTDAGGLSSLANLTINVHGSNDNPIATDDVTSAQAGSVTGGTSAVNGIGNVITAPSRPGTVTQPGGNGVDYDVDTPDQAPGALTVTGARTGVETSSDSLLSVTAGTTATDGLAITGSYGTLHIGADGSYSYVVDDTNPTVIGLAAGATITETFTYQVTDSTGLSDKAQLVVTVTGANDPPVAHDDSAPATEAGGVNNQTAGVNPAGNVLGNDADPDGDAISVTGIQNAGGTVGAVGSALQGTYGTLTLDADGQYTYVVDNSNAAVQALRTAGDHLSESFTYTITDSHGATATAHLNVVIAGQNDAPVAATVTGDATEAGGTNNATAGSNATGNVLGSVTDVDTGDSKTVDGAASGVVDNSGTFTSVTAPTTITGQYGTLTLQPDGTYSYAINNTLPAVDALAPGESLTDVFSYRVHDTAGATAAAQIQITIHGADDAPVAHLDANTALLDNGNGVPVAANGNVLNNDSDVDHGDQLTVTGAGVGEPSTNPAITGVTTGSSSTSNGLVLVGTYGTLTIGADGTYHYAIDVNNPTVIGLTPTQFRVDDFSYEVTDSTGLHDVGRLSILVRGRNDAPFAVPSNAVAVEAAGTNNTTPGLNPSGNVLVGDSDPDNDSFQVTSLHTGSGSTGGSPVAAGTPVRGDYGTLTLNADGSYSYIVNNDLPAVQALRTPGQTLEETFTYVITDQWGATASSTLSVTIFGRNDTPVAVDDTNTAVEAGGVHNATPGVNPVGNVLTNDTDVDSVANGETKAVGSFSNSNGVSTTAGTTLAGLYGSLTLNADGTYQYVVDNNNAQVEALLPNSAPLVEVFSYQMQDTAGAQSIAHLTISIRGADDAPVAHDDANVATDQIPAPQAVGNVLPNDTDVDANDHLTVVGVHTDGKNVAGTTGTVGQPIAGHYGTLRLNADGSYSYQIDMTNPDVLKAAGAGQVLKDTFTYTVSDQLGATDQAVLTINLDISAPYIPPSPPPDVLGNGPHSDAWRNDPARVVPQRSVDPVVFVTPVVQRNETQQSVSAWEADGSDLWLGGLPREISPSIGAGLGLIPDVYVTDSVHQSSLENAANDAWVMGRHARIDLTADGLLSDPSAFAVSTRDLTHNAPAAPHRPAPATHHGKPPPHKVAQGFKAQLQAAAPGLPPIQTVLHQYIENEA